MKKVVPFLLVCVVCAVLALRFYRTGFSLSALGSEGESGGLSDMDQPLPRAVLPTVDGDWANTSTSYKGKVVLLNVWATWCQPCREEIPDLIKLQEKFASRDFTIVAIAIDGGDGDVVKSFVQNERFSTGITSKAMNYPVLLGSDEAAREFGYEGEIPVSFLVTRDGKEVKIIRGNVASEEVSNAIEHLL